MAIETESARSGESAVRSGFAITRLLQPALSVFVIGMIGLAILALIYGDFALVWQPVAPWVPGRTGLAYASGVIMLFGGIGLLFRATAWLSARILFAYLIVWLLLKVPALVVAPQMEAVWLGFGELAVLLAGGWVLFARLTPRREKIGLTPQPGGSRLAFATGDGGIQIARILFGISLIPIGLSHLVYAPQTAVLVPAWLPFRLGLARLTGVGQIACGVGALFSRFARVAAITEAGMLGLFTLLVWGPAILTTPTARLPWTAFFISWAIMASAWLVAASLARRTPGQPLHP